MNNTFKETWPSALGGRSTPRRCSLHGKHTPQSPHTGSGHRRSAQDSPILAFSPSSCRAHGGRPFVSGSAHYRCMAEHLWTRRREGVRLRESRPTPPRGTHATRRTPTSREGKLAFCRNWWGSTPLFGSKKGGEQRRVVVTLSAFGWGAHGSLCTRVRRARDGSPLSALSRGARMRICVLCTRKSRQRAK